MKPVYVFYILVILLSLIRKKTVNKSWFIDKIEICFV